MTPQQRLEEAFSRIKEAEKNNSSELDLSNLELENDELVIMLTIIQEKLPNIERLNLEKNNISKISDLIESLQNLKSLQLGENKFEGTLPLEICNLPNLEDLDISKNEISKVTNEISKLQNLISLNLGHNKLDCKVMSKIGQLKNLEYLILNENFIEEITDVSNLQKLTYLDLSRNNLIDIDDICNIPSLIYLNISSTHTYIIPEKISELENIEILDFSDNQIQEVPDTINKPKKLEHLHLEKNKLTEETISSLLSSLEKTQIYYTSDSYEEESDYEKVLATLYPEEKDKINTLINSFDATWSFKNGNYLLEKAESELSKIKPVVNKENTQKIKFEKIVKENTLTAKEVIIEFLKKIPLDNLEANKIYVEGTKRLLDSVFNKNTSDDDKKNMLFQIAKALGNCRTPVINIIILSYIGKYKNTNPKPNPKEFNALIAREALEEEILSKLRNKIINEERILHPFEEIEQVQGLTNSVFLEEAIAYEDNKCKIEFLEGEKPVTLLGKTSNLEFSFTVVRDQLAIEFVNLCCKTNKNGEPLIGKDGKYVFSSEKLKIIVEKYESKYLLNISTRENAVNNYLKKIQKFITDNDDIHSLELSDTDYNDIFDTPGQAEKLRNLLSEADDSKVNEIATNFLDSKKNKIEKLLNDEKSEEMQIDDDTSMETSKKFQKIGTPPKTPKTPKNKRNREHDPQKEGEKRAKSKRSRSTVNKTPSQNR